MRYDRWFDDDDAIRSMKGISLEVAKTDLISVDLSYPTTYKQTDVELALAFLRNTHDGIEKTFELLCETDDDGNSFQQYGDDDDDNEACDSNRPVNPALVTNRQRKHRRRYLKNIQ